MTGPMAQKIGWAVARYFRDRQNCTRMIIGKDTRLSGKILEQAIATGVCTAGLDAYLAGIVPTSAVAYLVGQTANAAGIVISASHNPWYENGIKFSDLTDKSYL